LWLCCRQPEEVRGRDDYTLKNISTVVEFSLSLPGTNVAAESVFSLVNALWTDKRTLLEVSTVKSIVLVKHYFRNYKCPEFHDFLLRNRKILERIHKFRSIHLGPYTANTEEVPLTLVAASSSDFLQR
jgi:hypothetical protein